MTSSGYTLDLYCDNIQTIGDDRYHLGKLFHSWNDIPDAIDTFFADGPKCYLQVRKMAKSKGKRNLRFLFGSLIKMELTFVQNVIRNETKNSSKNSLFNVNFTTD